MKYIFRISSIIFRISLLLVPIVAFIASILVGAAGHSSNFKKTDDLLFVFCITTFIVLTFYENLKKETQSRVPFLLALILTLISFVFLIYFIVDTFFISEYKNESNPIFNGLLGFFSVINFVVLAGLLFDRKTLRTS